MSKNMVLPRYVPVHKHISMVHAIKHGSTCPKKITWYYHGTTFKKRKHHTMIHVQNKHTHKKKHMVLVLLPWYLVQYSIVLPRYMYKKN